MDRALNLANYNTVSINFAIQQDSTVDKFETFSHCANLILATLKYPKTKLLFAYHPKMCFHTHFAKNSPLSASIQSCTNSPLTGSTGSSSAEALGEVRPAPGPELEPPEAAAGVLDIVLFKIQCLFFCCYIEFGETPP